MYGTYGTSDVVKSKSGPNQLTPREESLILRPRSYTSDKWEILLVQCFSNKCPINTPDYMLKIPDSVEVLAAKLIAANRVFARIEILHENHIEYDVSA